jgi:rfaE bifunctional protein nucleotidyltransferase chain/domain
MRHPREKILSIESALQWRLALRHGQGGTLAVTNGCFDLLHAGHLQLLLAARNEADALLVLLNSDASIRSIKGQSRPIIPENDRALLLAGLACVSAVVLFKDARCAAELAALQPDVYVKSADYHGALDHSEQAALMTAGSRIEFVPVKGGISTSKILARIAGGAVLAPPAPPESAQRARSEGNGAIAGGPACRDVPGAGMVPAATEPLATHFAPAGLPPGHTPDDLAYHYQPVPTGSPTAAALSAEPAGAENSPKTSAPATAGDHSLPSASRSGGDHDGRHTSVGALSLSEVNAKAQGREGAENTANENVPLAPSRGGPGEPGSAGSTASGGAA